MQADDWQRLGLAEPTTDLLAIKRAYAARLKLTRPDDDAEAYQRLRQTYEWAQQWVRWQAEDGNEGQAEPAAEPAIDRTTVVSSTPPPAPEQAPAPERPHGRETDWSFTPESLVERAHAVWREEGDTALLAHWPSLRHGLDALPLSALPEASARLADLVIHVEALPDAFVSSLDAHFGWREDFRTARLIGAQRAAALLQVLDDRLVRPITDEAVLAQIEPLTRVARRAKQRQRTLATLEATLAGGVLQGLVDSLPARDWRALGFDAATQATVRAVLSLASSIRLGLGVALVGLTLWLAGQPVHEVLLALVFGGFVTMVGFFVTMWLTGSFGGWFALRQQATGFAHRLRVWHAHPRRLAVGFGVMAASVLAGAWAGGPWAPSLPLLPWVPWFVLVLLGTLVLWPQDLRHGAIVVLGAAVGTYCAFRWLPVDSRLVGTLPAVALSLGLVWALIASTAYERGWWGTRDARSIAMPQVWLFAPVVNSLGLCDRWGYRFAMAPVPVLVALISVGIVSSAPWRVFIGWILLVLAFGWGQEMLLRLAQRLPAPPEA